MIRLRPEATVNRMRRAAGSFKSVWPVRLLLIARAVAAGSAYVFVVRIPGLTSSFVAIFVALLAFDLMVASQTLRLERQRLQTIVSSVQAPLTETVVSLAKGLGLGISFGFAARLGVPAWLGAVLTAGLGYSWASLARNGFTAFVAILGGLAVYERIVSATGDAGAAGLWSATAPVAASVAIGTLTALAAGWLVGLAVGAITRAMLPRPYRSRRSLAYAPPYEHRPFDEVVHAGKEHRLIQLRLGTPSPHAGKTLADLSMRDQFGASVVAIERRHEDIALPRGNERLQDGDTLVVLCPSSQCDALVAWAGTNPEGVKA